jgi:Phytanoyl-CoA dioxygenase (PhyH)
MNILNVFKLLASEIIFKLNYPFLISNQKEILEKIKMEGYAQIDNFLSRSECEKLIGHVDEILIKKKEFVSIESDGSDLRIYGVDRLTNNFNIKKQIDLVSSLHKLFYFPKKKDSFTLLGKIMFKEGNKGSGTGWHRDSPFSHQFKTILYLSDVTEKNGPFQYLPKSHKFNNLVKISGYLKKPLNDDRFTEVEIDSLVKQGIIDEPITFCANQGTLILVDTRGLHRGKPLLSHCRYALTSYNYSNKLPQGISNLPVFKMKNT